MGTNVPGLQEPAATARLVFSHAEAYNAGLRRVIGAA